ncbi:hypothetical protein AcV7_008652 [Taiwanofungus camphoratus]|nr:hypothetical protein AcV7_008652 [Antrodia cinnamomea]
MSERFCTGYSLDFQDLISRFALDSATEFLFGSYVHSLHAPLPYGYNVTPPSSINTFAASPFSSNAVQEFGAAFAGAQRILSSRAQLGWIWPIFEVFRDKTNEHMKVLNTFVQSILEETVRKSESKQGHEEKNEKEEGEALLEVWSNVPKVDRSMGGSDPDVLRDEVFNVMIAGRDTTATALTFAVYFVVTHPAVFTKLRVEILGKVGPIQKPTFEIIRELPYLKAVINKTLRLFPPVPLDVRYSVKEGNLPNSDPNGKLFYVPANTSVRYSVFAMHRRVDLWGPDALEFDPYRFLDERLHKYLTNHRSSSYPSMQGPASALDSRYALLANVQLPVFFACNEISFFPIKLLQRLSGIELDHTAQPPDSLPPKDWASASGRKGMEQIFPKVHLTMYVDGGLDGDELSGLQV